LIARAHINEVPILLGISGRLSGIDGRAIYDILAFDPTAYSKEETNMVQVFISMAYHW
jgi:hypothetical protein